MKIYLPFLSLCLFTGACGLGEHSRLSTQALSEASPPIVAHNLRPHLYRELYQEHSRDKVQVLATIEEQALPAEIRNLPDGSEIGTLGVEYDIETYQNHYQDEVKPSSEKQLKDTKARVILIRTDGLENIVQLGIRRPAEAPVIQDQSSAVQVQSMPRAYCLQVAIAETHLFFDIHVKPQNATCDPFGACRAQVSDGHTELVDHFISFNLNAVPAGIKLGACQSTQLYYEKTETRYNSSLPWLGIVTLDSVFAKHTSAIQFEL
jgi:hypothetical protein